MSCCPENSAPYLAVDYTGKGKVGEVDGVSYYKVGRPSQRGLLLLPDVFGWNGGRIRAIADDFSKKGLSVWIPKVLEAFEGGTDDDGLPPTFNIKERGAELGGLLKGPWNVDKSMPKTLKVVEAMKAAGVKKFGVMGFCYGCWLGMHLSKEIPASELLCGVSPHPSAHIEGMVGGSPPELASKCQCPWSLFPCGKPDEGGDPDIYDEDGALFKALEEKMPGKNATKRLGDMFHGFVTRGAIKEGEFGADFLPRDPVRKAVTEVMDLTVEFFVKNGLMNKVDKVSAEVSVGMKLHALWDGVYYPAVVAAVSDSRRRSKAPYKIHWVGYEESEDVWVGLADLKSKKLPKPEPKPDTKAKAKGKTRKAPKIKLTYFNIEGVAEKVRLALVLGGIEFEDDRVSFDDWPELKKTTKYGQLPIMTLGDGEPMAQSGAMLRYCGRLARLYPPSAALKIEEAIGLEEDLGRAVMPSIYMGMKPEVYGYPEDMPKEERAKVQAVLRGKLMEAEKGDVVKGLGYLQSFLGDNDFMAGKSPTIADCQVIQRLRHLSKGVLDGIPKTILDDYPKLKAYFDRFHALPQVKAYYEKQAAAAAAAKA